MKNTTLFKSLGYWALLSTALLLAGCSSDNNGGQPSNKIPTILIANEGNMSTGTASLSAIMKDGSIVNDLFRNTNNRPIGDVAQSITLIDNRAFVALNNSAKIEVMSLDGFRSIATISIPGSAPRYILPLAGNRAVVSDYDYDAPCNKLHVINTSTHTLERSIDIGTTSQQMVVSGTQLFVATPDKIMIFNTSNLSKEGEITASTVAGGRLMIDKNGKIWLLEGGFDSNWMMNITQLTCIDPLTAQVVKTVPLNIPQTSFDGTYIDINPARDCVYFNSNKAIYAHHIEAPAFVNTPVFAFPSDLTSIYNVTLSPSGTIYLCDAMDFSAQRGYVSEYSVTGAKLRSLQAGISPQFLAFLP